MSHYTVLAAVELPEPDVEYLSQNRLALQVEGQLDDLLAPYEEGTNWSSLIWRNPHAWSILPRPCSV